MPNLSDITYTRSHSEVVEFVDQSRQAMINGLRGMHFNTNLSFDMKPEQGMIIPKLRLLMERPDGKIVAKLIVRCHFKVNLYAKFDGNDEFMGLPEEMYKAMSREVWNYARGFLKSRETPIAQAPLPEMPDSIFDEGLPPISLN
jgi:hypothetical protein